MPATKDTHTVRSLKGAFLMTPAKWSTVASVQVKASKSARSVKTTTGWTRIRTSASLQPVKLLSAPNVMLIQLTVSSAIQDSSWEKTPTLALAVK